MRKYSPWSATEISQMESLVRHSGDLIGQAHAVAIFSSLDEQEWLLHGDALSNSLGRISLRTRSIDSLDARMRVRETESGHYGLLIEADTPRHWFAFTMPDRGPSLIPSVFRLARGLSTTLLSASHIIEVGEWRCRLAVFVGDSPFLGSECTDTILLAHLEANASEFAVVLIDVGPDEPMPSWQGSLD